MSHSLSAVYLHAVFSTRDRRPFLEDLDVRHHMHATLARISGAMDCPAVRVGGVGDHVHVLTRFGRGVTPADWMKEMKRQSSLWVKNRYSNLSGFGWQAGYGVFSVAAGDLETVIHYIENQDLNHEHLSFQEEFLALLKEHGLEFDERYIWS